VTVAGDGAFPSILVVHARYRQRAGEDRAVESEVELLRSHGHRVETLFADNDAIDDHTLRGQISAGVTALWSRGAAARIRTALNRAEPDVVHVHNTFPVLSPAIYRELARWPGAVVQSVHNYRFACVSANFFRSGRECHDCLGKRLAWPGVVHSCYRHSHLASAVSAGAIASTRLSGAWSRVDRFVSPSRALAELLVTAGVSKARVRIKPNFVVRDPGIGTPTGSFLFAGRLAAEKGADVLVEAWSLLRKPPPLRIAGDGPLADHIQAMASRIPAIAYLGPLTPEAVQQEMQRASALVFPSRWPEPFGLSIIEAYAAGVPVIAARSGAAIELVDHGVTGLLCSPSDAGSLAETVAESLVDEGTLRKMRASARTRFLDRYSAHANYPMLAGIYAEALAARRRRGREQNRW
jgi:glycosyltransferase involved in cell wall biosynthesis